MKAEDLTDAQAALLRTYKPTDRVIGSGVFGSVYIFKSKENLKMLYAVKIMFLEDMDPGILQQVNEETRILAELDHPNIVKFIESFHDDKNLYIVMEFLDSAMEL